MGLTSHLSYAYDGFSSDRISFSSMMSMTKMYLMTRLTMMVLGPGYLVRALFYFFEISVYCVCGLFSVNGVTKSGCSVSGIFSV